MLHSDELYDSMLLVPGRHARILVLFTALQRGVGHMSWVPFPIDYCEVFVVHRPRYHC
jgi:hypothetical protein